MTINFNPEFLTGNDFQELRAKFKHEYKEEYAKRYSSWSSVMVKGSAFLFTGLALTILASGFLYQQIGDPAIQGVSITATCLVGFVSSLAKGINIMHGQEDLNARLQAELEKKYYHKFVDAKEEALRQQQAVLQQVQAPQQQAHV